MVLLGWILDFLVVGFAKFSGVQRATNSGGALRAHFRWRQMLDSLRWFRKILACLNPLAKCGHPNRLHVRIRK